MRLWVQFLASPPATTKRKRKSSEKMTYSQYYMMLLQYCYGKWIPSSFPFMTEIWKYKFMKLVSLLPFPPSVIKVFNIYNSN